jgi:folate-binding protein YgfZ
VTDHFGNPLLEQRMLEEGKAYVERTDQEVIRLSGDDARSWLHALVSQDILNLEDGSSTEALLLDPQGRIEQQLKVVREQDDLLVIVSKEKTPSLIDWLSKMRFRSKVQIEKTNLRVFGVLAGASGNVWKDPFSNENSFSVSYNNQRKNFPYSEIISQTPPDLTPAGLSAYAALRIFAGRPEISDVDEKSLPHEFDWLQSAVHLSKGCYRGQESVAKVHNLGHPPRRLAILHLSSGDDLASKSDKVFYQDKEVGKVLAGGIHYEAGSIALALVSRNTPYLDLLVEISNRKVPATQEVLVPADAGKAANLPRPSSFKLSNKR